GEAVLKPHVFVTRIPHIPNTPIVAAYAPWRRSNEGMSQSFRIEHDTMGEVQVPAEALYGAQTQRAVENFPISRMRFGRSFLIALGLIKIAAVHVHQPAENLSAPIAQAIETAAAEVREGRHDSQFVVDVFQTGSETSTN